MAHRGGLGPVFAFEWLTATRRWQMYALRSGFVGLLLLGLGVVWMESSGRLDHDQIKAQAKLAHEFYQALVLIALVMVLLAAPAPTAGAICLDTARGTLLHVLVTDLSDSEVVLGKLAARLVPVVGLIACSLPVLALGTLLGGIDPVALTGAFVVLLGVALLGCTLALALSVWGRKTHEVLLATYLVWALWFLLAPGWELLRRQLGAGSQAPEWVFKSNPFLITVLAHDPSVPSSPGLGDQVLFLVLATVVSTALLALTVSRLRAVIIGQWGRAEPRRKERSQRRMEWAAWGWGPSLDGNPVLWREWQRRRPSRWGRIVWRIYIVLGVGFSVVTLQSMGAAGPNRELPSVTNGFQASLGLLLLSVTSATSLSEERTRGSLDLLLVTPLSTLRVIWGKWSGAFRGVVLLAILPTVVAAALATNSGRWVGPPLILALFLAYGAAITSLGLALATWISNPGRVLALCVSAVVGVTVGSIPVVFMLFQPNWLAPCVAMVSPFFGIGYFSDVIAGHEPRHMWPATAAFALLWTAVYGAIACFLFLATLATFDRCLGRIPDRVVVAPQAPVDRKPKRKAAVAILDDY
jgi:ABC-type transport system involved in multi-copper enzyme maturation permease subunit